MWLYKAEWTRGEIGNRQGGSEWLEQFEVNDGVDQMYVLSCFYLMLLCCCFNGIHYGECVK